MNNSEGIGLSRRTLLRSSALASAALAVGAVATAEPAAAAAPPLDLAGPVRPAVRVSAAKKSIPTPEQYFGFKIGSEGKLATWDRMVPYFEMIAERSNRVTFEKVGDTTNGHPYILLTISSKKNLANLDNLVELNSKLADPRGLSPTEAKAIAAESVPFYYVQAGIHSTEVGNSQATIDWAYRLATEDSDYIEGLLDNLVILLNPCQNPDGLVLVNDYFTQTAGTAYARTYPDLYNRYNGHDDNRDWFMLTQIESKLNASILNKYHPQVFQDSHQAGSGSPRMFTPPYLSPYDINIDPILVQSTDTVGLAMQRGMTAAGMKGGGWGSTYDYWTPSRQYCVYHGAVRILTEAASCSNLAYTLTSDKPIGRQDTDISFIQPYDKTTWSLQQIVDYVTVAFYSGIESVAYDTFNWLYNSWKVATNAVTSTAPFAYVIPAGQRDPQAVLDTLNIFHTGNVEISQASSAFTADGKSYPAGSYIIFMQQPYKGFAKTLLEVQDYPQLLEYPGGPPQRPYDVTAQTLPMLLGFQATAVTGSFSAAAKKLKNVKPEPVTMPPAPPAGGAYVLGPESYGVFRIVTRLQAQGIPTFRAAAAFSDGGRDFAPGTWVVPPTSAARTVLQNQAPKTGIPVGAISAVPKVKGLRLKSRTRIGMLKPAGNAPSGWMMWTFDQYKVNYQVVKAQHFANLAGHFDAIIMPQGVSKSKIVNGLDSTKYPKADWSWAFGVGEDGYAKLADFVTGGGTLIAFGSGTDTAVDLFGLPLTSVLPTENTEFYCPGSLLSQEIDTTSPAGWGMTPDNPVWFDGDDAFEITDAAKYPHQVVAKYPDSGEQLQSGWLIGGEALNGAINGVSWTVGKGTVLTFGSEIAFRTWNRSEERMIFNAMYNGPATELTATQFSNLNTVV
ncbi:M14 family zinc carboxypeptidase [Nakamurella lactea]|uniref:M14 family zinc carboxypeptidase n=1 Tax=Nakamurella lactea TaxID=459515 RepID=UPI0003FD3C6F|nr:M14 family zinc carboxypeptidase [Nakamurella lactea]